jgi:hypothetical protein
MIPILKDKDKLTLNGKQLRKFAKLNYDSGKQAEQKRMQETICEKCKYQAITYGQEKCSKCGSKLEIIASERKASLGEDKK